MTRCINDVNSAARFERALSCLDVAPLIKGFFAVALVVGAVMSSAFGPEN